MRVRTTILAVAVALSLWSALFAFQRGGFRQYFDEEGIPLVTPPDADEKTEYAFARLKYPSQRRYNWTIDYPKADRQFVQGVRRLSRVHVRSVEQVVDLDSDEIFNWPWIYGVELGFWELNDQQIKRLREYLLRGGFFMTDDCHGTYQWNGFVSVMNKVFPDRPIVELENKDAIFHVLYDLEDRIQIPGLAALYRGQTYEQDGVIPRWRAIYDDKGRIMVAICHNMDLGDAWEHADAPWYPEKYTSMAYRVGLNYIIYSMTH